MHGYILFSDGLFKLSLDLDYLIKHLKICRNLLRNKLLQSELLFRFNNIVNL